MIAQQINLRLTKLCQKKRHNFRTPLEQPENYKKIIDKTEVREQAWIKPPQ